jgi:hypothetical protein
VKIQSFLPMMRRLLRTRETLFLFVVFFSINCFSQKKNLLFTLQKPDETRVKFNNRVREDDSLHVLSYEYLYNGHGIGIADFNNDGFEDIFISGNKTSHKLFLNRGNLTFEDITRDSGTQGNGTWGTGVSVADVNGDGLYDIYVSHSGKFPAEKLTNELFINTGVENGKPKFKEQAEAYGLHCPGTQSTQSAFFDFDRDGDLDMFLLNHSIHSVSPFLNTRRQRATPDLRYGNRLFRNDLKPDGTMSFTDITPQSGIINNALNYGLSVNISDINHDGWPDIYTTSDYSEHDCLYINNHNGTFTQSLQRSFHHISKFSMGADIADFNNDGLADVFTLDMLPADNHRQKLLKGPDEYDQYHLLTDSGYYRQHMRNMLQLNRGKDASGNIRFSEIGQLAGVSNTDWSWAGLFADFDLDGWKDLVVTNGYLRDFTDLDFLKYTMPDAQLAEAAKGNINFRNYQLVQKMPSNKLNNYLFKNNGDLTFRDVSKEWGFNTPSVSNAAAYADFDNDGDLDLIIGNNNEPVMFWKNNFDSKDRHWLKVNLHSTSGNRFAYGSKVWVYEKDRTQYQELYPVRGYQSTVSPILHFGIPSGKIDSLVIEWPSGKISRLHPAPDQMLTLNEEDAREGNVFPKKIISAAFFKEVSGQERINFTHKENDFIDFKGEVLLPYQLSKMGPALAKGDVNNDGNEDVYIGGAIGQAGELYLQGNEGTFVASPYKPWKPDSESEDVNGLFFDADSDRDLDLYVVSGGNEYEDGSPEFQDRLYLNDGTGVFTKSPNALPLMRSNKQAVASADFDNDGDLDLFVGGRGKPGYFPMSSRSYLLRNDSQSGQIIFTDVTQNVCPDLQEPGMVTVAEWVDLDQDHFPELFVAGDWMPILLFKNEKGTLNNISDTALPRQTNGMWSAIHIADLDNDGDKDVVMGNCGLNNQFKPSVKEPMTMVVNDFDGNGNSEPLISYFIQGKSYPMASRDELLDQVPSLRKKYVKYIQYADATTESIFNKQQITNAKVFTCTLPESILLINNGSLSFTQRNIPPEAQFSKTHAILSDDYNHDGHTDLVMLGNFFPYRTQTGESDASFGSLLLGDGKGNFSSVPPSSSGLFADGDVRSGVVLKNISGKERLLIGRNNSPVLIFSILPSPKPKP